MDGFCKALEQRGHRVQARTRGQNAAYESILVKAVEEDLSIQLEEKLGRKPHVLTTDERREKERWEKHGWGTWNRAPKYDYYPSGELKLSIRLTHYKYTGRKSWSDTKTQRLQDLLGHAIIALEAAAQVGRHERLEAERLERARRDVERKRLRAERLKWYGRKLAEELESMASAWKKAAEIREFLAAYDHVLPAHRRSEVAERWFAGARNYVERLDPLQVAESLAKELEPSDEVLEQMIAAEKRRANE